MDSLSALSRDILTVTLLIPLPTKSHDPFIAICGDHDCSRWHVFAITLDVVVRMLVNMAM